MARGKKAAATLTPEEKLQQALVPVEEQPYEVPENWCWTFVDKVSTVITGGTPSKKNPEYYGGDFPFFKPADLDEGRHVFDASEYLTEEGKSVSRIIPAKSTAVCCIGSIGKCGYLEKEGTTNQQINSAIPKFNAEYLFYFMNTDNFVNQLWAKSSATTIAIVNKAKMESCVFPLAPLAEQQRIVERIESIFAKLDEAKEKAQAVVDGFELRKSAILHKAFTGELTAQWRNNNNPPDAIEYLSKIQNSDECFSRKEFKFWKNGRLPIGWAESKIGNLLYFAGRIGWKGLKAEEYTEEGPLLLSVYNLNDGDEVSYSRVYHITDERYEESPEIMVQIGDVLLTKDGAGIGKLGYVKELPQKATINSSLLLIRPANAAISKYIYYILLGPSLQRIVKERITGSATPHLFQRDIKEFIIPVPSLEEQVKIVQLLDEVLSKEQQARDTAEAVIDQIDTIKKSVLARAFRGELGTNDPAEESAMELLRSVL